MEKPTIILATSNGVGMGHLARASAVALAIKDVANPIIVSRPHVDEPRKVGHLSA